jgi:hypothetical protein
MYYIIQHTENESYTIMAVKASEEESFQQEYAGKILAKGESIQEILIEFGQLKKG